MMTFVLKSTANRLNESDQHSFIDHDDILLDDEQRIDYFGKLYAQQPQNFRFQSGDRLLIKELVSYVASVVDANGNNSGLRSFKTKKSTRKTANKTTKKNLMQKHPSKNPTGHSSLIEINTEQLTTDLIKRVRSCMYSHRANYGFDIDLENDIHEDIVHIRIENGAVDGTIRCIICDKENKHKNKPKHVHYSSGSDWPCWVLSNFTKHLKNAHHLKFHKLETDLVDTNDVSHSNKNDVLPEENQDESVVCLNPSFQITSKSTEQVDAISSILYTQLSGQITRMMSVVLNHSESQEQMYFDLSEGVSQQLTVATIVGDGNCLYSALVHQLENNRLKGKAHKSATDKLRHDVCDYILENYSNFAPFLKNRVYELKESKDIDNMDTECKLFVRLCLTQNGKYGGAETIHAVSQMKKVNIVIFNENGPCHMLANVNENYNRTICIAYQQVRNAKGEALDERNHYVSVCDIDSTALYNAARAIANNQK